MLELVLATRNSHKLREFSGLMAGYEILPLPDEVELPPEDGSSFAENASGKAVAAAAATGRATIADDSGISAFALGGEPGIYSARYAGPDASDNENLAKLIDQLREHDDRRVEYVCAIAYVEPGGEPVIFEGTCGGRLILDPRGGGGFGYDPAVVPDDVEGDRTMAQLSAAEKDAISHRGRAVRELLAWLLQRRGPDIGETASR